MKRLLFLLLLTTAFSGLYAQPSTDPLHRDPWDIFIGPMGGIAYSNMAKLDGENKLGVSAGFFVEDYIVQQFSIGVEVNFSHLGTHNALNLNHPENGHVMDYRMNMLTVNYLAHYYLLRERLDVFSGVGLGRLVYAKCNNVDLIDDDNRQLHRGAVHIPLGVRFNYKNIILDARYNFMLNTWAKTNAAKRGMSNSSRTNYFQLSLGYRFQIF